MSAEVKILFQRLDVDNYATWQTQMKFLHIAKNCPHKRDKQSFTNAFAL